MLQALITRFLQHIIKQNKWAKPLLLPFAGNALQFDFVLAKAQLMVLEDGSFMLASSAMPPQATIYAPPSLLLRVVAGDDAAKMQFKITGDTHFASTMGNVLQNIRWDIEEDLSQITGDITAQKIVQIAKNTVNQTKQQTRNAAEMLTEYWQEEKPILAKKWQVVQHNTDVDTLKSDVARFEKRIQTLSQKITANNES